ALRVKVTARTCRASSVSHAARRAMRRVSTRVLPDPAPARIRNGTAGAVTARAWASSRPCTSASASIRPTLPTACDAIGDAGEARHRHAGGRPLPSPAVVDVSPSRFEALVAEALDGIPAALASRMDNVAVVVRDHGGDPNLFGLYEGI